MSRTLFSRFLSNLSTRSLKARARKMRAKTISRRRTRKLLGIQPLEGRALMATFTVDLVTDENDGNFSPGDLSLREAVAQANANGAGEDTIQFATGLPNLTLTLGQLPITSAIVIDVAGKGIAAGPNSRHFDIAPGASLRLNRPVLGFGNVAGQGGSIFNRGTLTIDSGILHNNTASQGGAIFNGPGGVLSVDRLPSMTTLPPLTVLALSVCTVAPPQRSPTPPFTTIEPLSLEVRSTSMVRPWSSGIQPFQ